MQAIYAGGESALSIPLDPGKRELLLDPRLLRGQNGGPYLAVAGLNGSVSNVVLSWITPQNYPTSDFLSVSATNFVNGVLPFPTGTATLYSVSVGWTEVAVGVVLVTACNCWLDGGSRHDSKAPLNTNTTRLLKNYESQIKTREQAARVAELLALNFDPKAEPMRFNQLAWELSLWLPSSLVCDLTRCLVGTKDSKNPKEILIEVRKILLQSPNDPLRPENIVHREDPRGRAELAAALIKDPIAKSMTQ